MRRIRRVAPALAAGAIALSTTICPIKAAAERLGNAYLSKFYRLVGLCIYEAPENVWLTTSGLIRILGVMHRTLAD